MSGVNVFNESGAHDADSLDGEALSLSCPAHDVSPTANKIAAIVATLGVVLGACYMLWLYKRVWFSEITNNKIENLKDVGVVDLVSLGSMAVLVVVFGVMPNLILSYFELPVADLVGLFGKVK